MKSVCRLYKLEFFKGHFFYIANVLSFQKILSGEKQKALNQECKVMWVFKPVYLQVILTSFLHYSG